MLRCCRLVKKGRFVVGEPFFAHSDPVTLAHAKRYTTDVGKLAIVETDGRMGRVVEVLGEEHHIHGVMRGLLAEDGALGTAPGTDRELGDPPMAVQRQLDDFDDEVPLFDERLDLRNQLCVTIDPPDARDFDDAIGLEPVEQGGGKRGAAPAWVLWVHIADVSAYVDTSSALDIYALERALSVYVPGMVAAMLPERLSSDLCSLRPGVDRGTVSVRMELDADFTVTGASFARAMIRSARRLSYDDVDALLSGETAIDPAVDELLRELSHITQQLRERRMRAGSLDMQLPETEFELGETQPSEAVSAAESPSHRLVEECMLLANQSVGRRLAIAERPAIFRIHDEPDPSSVEHLLQMFERLGVPTPPAPADMTSQDASRVAAAAAKLARRYSERSGRGRASFAPLVLRSLKQAVYRAHPGRHSGLAMQDYLHFTSPIRRYPDLVNHRSLLAYIGDSAATGSDTPAAMPLDEVAQHVSERERDAMRVERLADRIVLSHLLHDRLMAGEPPRSTGEVIGVISSGIFVRFGDVFEGFLPARTLAAGERHEIDDHGLALVGTRSGERLQIGDPVEVEVVRVNRANGKVDLRRLTPAGVGDGERHSTSTGADARGAGAAARDGADSSGDDGGRHAGGRNRAARRRGGGGGRAGGGRGSGTRGGRGRGGRR